MSNDNEQPNLLRLILRLQNDPDARPEQVDSNGLSRRMALLRQWQSERLALTYADLLTQPDTAPACRFFLEQIYGPQDFSQRDADFERLHAILARFLPEPMLWVLSEAIRLNRLTNRLDTALLKALVEQLGMTDTLTAEMYAEGYRLCDNYAERAEQIDLLARLLHEVGVGARLPLVAMTLRLSALPARRAGWSELYNFLSEGYAAFKQVKDHEAFVTTIATRERAILDEIYGVIK